MGNILTTVISYNKTDVYVFKDTNNIVTTMCRIKFIEVESFPSTAATYWTITYTANVLNSSKYDVTLEYKPNRIDVLTGYTNFTGYDATTNNTEIKFTVGSTPYTGNIAAINYDVGTQYTSINDAKDAFFNAIASAMNTAYTEGNFSFGSNKDILNDDAYTLNCSTMNTALNTAIFGSSITSDISSSSVLSDYTLPVYDPSDSTKLLLLATFTPVAFIFDSDNVIVTPSASDTNFTVTIVDTNTLIVNTAEFNSAIFRVTDIETEIYGYVRHDNGTIESDVAVTRNEIEAVTTNKNFNKRNRVVLKSIPLTKGRWLIEATGSFDCSAAFNQVYFWFDEGGLLDELALVPQFKNSLRTFNSGSNTNTNMTITMQCEFFFEDSTLIYWCTTPDIEIESSIFSTTIPNSLPTQTPQTFIEYAITSNTGTNNAKITAISISGV